MNTNKITYTGVFCALIAAATIMIKIPIPRTQGYLNLGDGVIFLCALFLEAPYCAAAAGLGSALGDVLSGAGIYVFPTLIIKGLMGFVAARKINKKELKKSFLFLALAEAVMVLGYFLFESIFFGFAAAAFGALFNLIQGIFGIALGSVLIAFAKRLKT